MVCARGCRCAGRCAGVPTPGFCRRGPDRYERAMARPASASPALLASDRTGRRRRASVRGCHRHQPPFRPCRGRGLAPAATDRATWGWIRFGRWRPTSWWPRWPPAWSNPGANTSSGPVTRRLPGSAAALSAARHRERRHAAVLEFNLTHVYQLKPPSIWRSWKWLSACGRNFSTIPCAVSTPRRCCRSAVARRGSVDEHTFDEDTNETAMVESALYRLVEQTAGRCGNNGWRPGGWR